MYKKGATVPNGKKEFRFEAGDLDFHNASKLVIQLYISNKCTLSKIHVSPTESKVAIPAPGYNMRPIHKKFTDGKNVPL